MWEREKGWRWPLRKLGLAPSILDPPYAHEEESLLGNMKK